ncbi:unnamed protein product [Leptidea sinapis]|uniref:Peptidase S1 domain-containing protein n=1 Tax=Leptidea sinapis TaxID=189913 RepID=A0A5E4PV97_9NEOP|nr:unnamed protein product [Leptidea sinapis]
MMGGCKFVYFLIQMAFFIQDVYSDDNNDVDDKIIGGRKVNITDYRFYVLVVAKLSDTREGNCGGSIINPKHAITAAHCLIRAKSVKVRPGISSKHESLKDKPFIGGKYKIHEKYSVKTLSYDVAMITLNKDIVMGDYAQPVNLIGADEEIPVGAKVTVVGFGKISDDGRLSDDLKAVDLEMYSDQYCHKYYSRGPTATQICAGHDKDNQSTCGGDSGGPIVFHKTNKQLALVTAGGRKCAKAKYPKLFTKLSNKEVHDWIKKHSS